MDNRALKGLDIRIKVLVGKIQKFKARGNDAVASALQARVDELLKLKEPVKDTQIPITFEEPVKEEPKDEVDKELIEIIEKVEPEVVEIPIIGGDNPSNEIEVDEIQEKIAELKEEDFVEVAKEEEPEAVDVEKIVEEEIEKTEKEEPEKEVVVKPPVKKKRKYTKRKK